jgi:hypothetical protein
MFDENSLERRLALAPYEELTARLDARREQIRSDFERDLAEADRLAAEREQAAAAEWDRMREEAAAFQSKEDWTAPRQQRDTMMSFGEFEDEDRAMWSTPTPPMGFPPPPPIPEPIPEVIRDTPPQPMMSFGDFEDEESPPPARPQAPPPRPGRRRLRDDDDEDMSGETWLS